jgi:hypothetical protein
MTDAHAPTRSEAEVLHTNRRFYEALWSDARLIAPERFNTWPLFGALAGDAQHRLEVAPGLRPRLPLADTCFVDMSHAALRGLHRQGARTAHAMIGALPFPDAQFDLVCALDILEHVVDDLGALADWRGSPPPMPRCCSRCRWTRRRGPRSTTSSATTAATSRRRLPRCWPRTAGASSAARCTA